MEVYWSGIQGAHPEVIFLTVILTKAFHYCIYMYVITHPYMYACRNDWDKKLLSAAVVYITLMNSNLIPRLPLSMSEIYL